MKWWSIWNVRGGWGGAILFQTGWEETSLADDILGKGLKELKELSVQIGERTFWKERRTDAGPEVGGGLACLRNS